MELKKSGVEGALYTLDLLIEGLSLKDPSRIPFTQFRSLFTNDLGLEVNRFEHLDTDSLTELIKLKLDNRIVAEQFSILIDTIKEYKEMKESEKSETISGDIVSVVKYNVDFEIGLSNKKHRGSLRVLVGNDVETKLYHTSLDNAQDVEVIERPTEGNVVVELTSTYNVKKWLTPQKKKLYVINECKIEDVQLLNGLGLNKDTSYVTVKKIITVPVSTIVDAGYVKIRGTTIILSTSKVIVEKDDTENIETFIIKTNNKLLEGKKYYRVMSENNIITGTYSYDKNNQEPIELITIINKENITITDADVIKQVYHIYSNKAEADELAVNFVTYLKDRENTLEELKENKIAVEKAVLDSKKNDASIKKTEAHTAKLNKEANSIDKDVAKKDKDNSVQQFKLIQEALELQGKLDKIEADSNKSDAESAHIDMKTILVTIGVGVAGYSLYTAIKPSDAFASKALVKGMRLLM